MEEKYKHFKEAHPEWSHEQIMAAVSIVMSSSNEITKAGPDVRPDDPELIRSILQGARNWLHDVLPEVFTKIADFFDILIRNIGSVISKGLGCIIDAIEYLYEKSKVIKAFIETPVEE